MEAFRGLNLHQSADRHSLVEQVGLEASQLQEALSRGFVAAFHSSLFPRGLSSIPVLLRGGGYGVSGGAGCAYIGAAAGSSALPTRRGRERWGRGGREFSEGAGFFLYYWIPARLFAWCFFWCFNLLFLWVLSFVAAPLRPRRFFRVFFFFVFLSLCVSPVRRRRSSGGGVRGAGAGMGGGDLGGVECRFGSSRVGLGGEIAGYLEIVGGALRGVGDYRGGRCLGGMAGF
jgi:hypothetical protein